MDELFAFLVISFVFIIFFIKKKSQQSDEFALEQEIQRDFELDFQTDSNGRLTDEGIEALIEWFENDSNSLKLSKSAQRKDLVELI